ncbi:MAG: hypothetical protein HY695_25230 [Deltaproteobacteria bacterium]|nr:hypothetical protein [Deltaproteobacteria bacterium]
MKYPRLQGNPVAGVALACLGLLTWVIVHQTARPASPKLEVSALRSRFTDPDQSNAGQATQAYGKLPLSFEANHGQTDPHVRFLAHGSGYGLFLSPKEAVLVLEKNASQRANAALPVEPS